MHFQSFNSYCFPGKRMPISNFKRRQIQKVSATLDFAEEAPLSARQSSGSYPRKTIVRLYIGIVTPASLIIFNVVVFFSSFLFHFASHAGRKCFMRTCAFIHTFTFKRTNASLEKYIYIVSVLFFWRLLKKGTRLIDAWQEKKALRSSCTLFRRRDVFFLFRVLLFTGECLLLACLLFIYLRLV